MTVVMLNGKFFGEPGGPALNGAMLSAFDAGFQHAVGLFETMLGGTEKRGVEGERSHGEVEESWVLHLDEHMERLAGSAKQLGLSEQLRTVALGEAVLETVRRCGLRRARVRLTITGGDLAMLAAARNGGGGAVDPTVMIVAQPATEYPAAMFEKGVAVTLAQARSNPLNGFEGHKTLNYWWRLRELQLAAAKGAGEALVLSVTNHVCGGCVSNVLCVKGEEVVTPLARGEEGGTEHDATETGRPRSDKAPVLHSPVLPGVTRAWALEKAERLGLSVTRRMLSVQDVVDADEVMLTNSSWGVLPVVRVERNQIGMGTPGRVSADLRRAWEDMLPGEEDRA
jgi:branched-chain amino acid aminotransferase